MSKVIICGVEVNNQKQITAEMMMEYIEQNAPQDKKWFKENSMAMMPDMTFELTNEYEEKTNKNGEKTKKRKRKVIKTGKSEKFNISKARKNFCERYFPELSKKKESVTEKLNNW